MGVLEPTDAQIERMVQRAAAWDDAVAGPERLAEINAMAMRFFADRVDTGWAGAYLDQRLPGWRTHPHTTAGYAPAGWTTLVDHLGGRGVTDDELLQVGLATRARTGALIDRFRDRAVLPITHDHQHPRVRRTPPPRPDRHRRARRAEVPQHARHRPVPQGRPALRGHPRPARERRDTCPRRRTLRRPGRHPRRQPAVRRRRTAGHRSDRRTSPTARHPQHLTDRRHRRRPGRASRRRT